MPEPDVYWSSYRRGAEPARYVYVRLTRPEGYEDVDPQLIVEDAGIKVEFLPEVVEQPAQAQGWQPIETAPRDETTIIVARHLRDPERIPAMWRAQAAHYRQREAAAVERVRAVNEDLAMMIRMLVSSLKRHWPHAPQPGDLPTRAVDLLRRHSLLGSPLREEADDGTPKAARAELERKT